MRIKLYFTFILISLMALTAAAGCVVLPVESSEIAPPQNATEPASTLPGSTADSAGATASVAPAATTPTEEDTHLVDVDPVSGRNDEVDFRWEQLCVASEYQVQIAKDSDFALIVVDTGPFAPSDVTAPSAYYPAGGTATNNPAPRSSLDPGTSAIGSLSTLEAGHTYYARVRVRQTATGLYLLSPWSQVYKFTVKSGLPMTSPGYSPQPLSPNNGCIGCPVAPVAFSWTPFKDTTTYKFVLAKDAAMTEVIAEAMAPTTAYNYQGNLAYSASYFWHVMAIQPVPSDWSPTFVFQTEAAPAAAPAPAETPGTPLWAWVLIAVGAILVIAVITLVVLTRRT
jgi:hypothetical protein